MKQSNFFVLILFLYFFQPSCVHSYSLPFVNLGSSNILDGGPIRPLPGWYIIAYEQYYQSHTFLDGQGNLLGGVPSPDFKELAAVLEIIYQSEKKLLGADIGASLFVTSVVEYSHLAANSLGIKSSGGGFGDLLIGLYLQWLPVMYKDRPLFVHRLEFDVIFPTGEVEEPPYLINPGNNVIYIDPYWAGTLYFTTKFAASWRLHYLWVGKNRYTGIKAGDAVHMNFDLEYEIVHNLWLGFGGYFLQQLQDDNLHGVKVPNSKERVVGLGPGLLYEFSQDFYLFAYGYGELDVRNRPQGVTVFLKLIAHF